MARTMEASTWMVLLDERIVGTAERRDWAARRILDADSDDLAWLAELATLSDDDEAIRSLASWLPRQPAREITQLPAFGVGVAYLRFLAGEIALAELLQVAGTIADGASWDQPDCESLFGLLNDLENGIDVSSATDAALRPFAATAAEQMRAAQLGDPTPSVVALVSVSTRQRAD